MAYTIKIHTDNEALVSKVRIALEKCLDKDNRFNATIYKGGTIDLCCRQTPVDCYWFQSMGDCSYAIDVNHLCKI